MVALKHEHTEDCPYSKDGSYLHYLVTSAPEYLWFDVQDVGSYQGSVYGVAIYNNQIAIYEDYYGSCSGCGAWGEGGEPKDLKEVISHSTFFDNTLDAISYLTKIDKYESPNVTKMIEAIKDAFTYIKKVKKRK